MELIIIIVLLVVLLFLGIMQFCLLKELKKQKRIAENANKVKSHFLSSMSHEIRTPINTILGMDELILRESKENAIKEYAMDIQAAGRTLLTVVSDILDQREAESGKLVIIPVEYEVPGMLFDLSNATKLKASNKDVAFDVSAAPGIPVKLWGDVARIRQILMYLLESAINSTPKGTVTFRVKYRQLETDEKTAENRVVLRFEVESSECDVTPDNSRGQFWEKLLGLMGSELNVTSEYKKGTIFSFDLKQKIVDGTPMGDFNKHIRNRMLEQAKETETFQAPDAHVLVVDDNSVNRKLFKLLLKPTQINVTEAGSGQESIDLAGKQYFDVIFMDHMMPGMDGIEAMKRIKAMKDGPCAATPIIVLTANSIVGAKEKYMEDGFDGFLSKPVESAQLMDTLRKILLEKKESGNKQKGKVERDRKEGDKIEQPVIRTVDNDQFPIISGIDWKVAMMRFQDKNSLDVVLKDFERSIDHQTDKLQGFKEELPASMNDYRILVHGVKSAAGSLGILPLSGMASMLERAAAAGDEDVIDRLHDVFLKEWRSYKDRLREYLHGGDEKADEVGNKENTKENTKEKISPEILRVLLRMLSTAMAEMDIDEADEAIEKLSSFQLPEEVEKEFDELKTAVTRLDQARVKELLANVREMME